MSKTVLKNAFLLFEDDDNDKKPIKKHLPEKQLSTNKWGLKQEKRRAQRKQKDGKLKEKYSQVGRKKLDDSASDERKTREQLKRNVQFVNKLRSLKLKPEVTAKLVSSIYSSKSAVKEKEISSSSVFTDDDFAKFAREYVAE